jgi:hypothetical protein
LTKGTTLKKEIKYKAMKKGGNYDKTNEN